MGSGGGGGWGGVSVIATSLALKAIGMWQAVGPFEAMRLRPDDINTQGHMVCSKMHFMFDI